jgi:hypothetical protein
MNQKSCYLSSFFVSPRIDISLCFAGWDYGFDVYSFAYDNRQNHLEAMLYIVLIIAYTF